MKQPNNAKVEKARTAAAVAKTEVEMLKSENSHLIGILDRILANQKKSRRHNLINVLFWIICFSVLLYDKVKL